MKGQKIIRKGLIILALSLLALANCGGSSSSISTVGNPTGGTTGDTIENKINTGTAAVKQTPPLDPNSADSAGSSSASALVDEFADDFAALEATLVGETLDILVTQKAPTGSTKSGTVEMFQCNGNSQGSYTSVVADNTSSVGEPRNISFIFN